MEIRRIEAKAVTDTVKELFLRCNYEIGQDILDALAQASGNAGALCPWGGRFWASFWKTTGIAAQEQLPICQGYGHGVFICGIRRPCNDRRRQLLRRPWKKASAAPIGTAICGNPWYPTR